MAISKVIYGGKTLIDLTADNITADKLLSGIKAHGADGEVITGTCTYDANTQDATATAAEILSGKTAYNKAQKVTGTMPNNGAMSGFINEADSPCVIPRGYHDGSGTVGIDSASHGNLVASNIRQGVKILGVTGTMSGTEAVKAQDLIVTPSTSELQLQPDYNQGYNYLSSVLVNPIPYVETDNSAGGKTVTIG